MERVESHGPELWKKYRGLPVFGECTSNKPGPTLFRKVSRLKDLHQKLNTHREKAILSIRKDWMSRLGNLEKAADPRIEETFRSLVNVVGATCIHSGGDKFRRDYGTFDMVIVDEVSKATPSELLIPCLLGKRVVLVGDHKQLPPMVGAEKSYTQKAEELGLQEKEIQAVKDSLGVCLFKERFEAFEGGSQGRTLMLTRQYRMHGQIMAAINQFYDGMLEQGIPDGERGHGLQSGSWLQKDRNVIWCDIPGDRHWEFEQGEGSRKGERRNRREAELVIRMAREIAQSAGRSCKEPLSVGITSPYRWQAELLEKMARQEGLFDDRSLDRLRITSIDRFQGKERDVMLVSLVLNKKGKAISPFLQTPERINVAFSRARRLLVIVGSVHNYTEVPSGASEAYGKVLKVAEHYGGKVGAPDVMEAMARE